MAQYRVCFLKTVLSSDGHPFKCPQQIIAVTSDTREEAVEAAKRKFQVQWDIRDWQLHADEIDANEAEWPEPRPS